MSLPGKSAEARENIAEALKDSVLLKDAKTFYVAGKIEANEYQEALKKLSINRNDPNVDKVAMADALMAAVKYYRLAMALDTVIDSKGNVKTHYSQQLYDWINSQIPQFYNSGIAYLNKKRYYPQAYQAFTEYAESPLSYPEGSQFTAITDSARANAYFYAGVMAFNAGEYAVSAESFRNARAYNYPRKEVIINEMICYKQMADADSSFTPEATLNITLLGKEGIKKFGIKPPVFLQKFVGGAIRSGETNEAYAVVDSLLTLYPEAASLLRSLRAELLLAKKDTLGATTDYRMAAEDSAALFQTLLETSRLMAKEGIRELSQITGTNKAARKKSKEIKNSWLIPARQFAERAKLVANKREGIYGELTDEEIEMMIADLDNILATIDYNLLQ